MTARALNALEHHHGVTVAPDDRLAEHLVNPRVLDSTTYPVRVADLVDHDIRRILTEAGCPADEVTIVHFTAEELRAGDDWYRRERDPMWPEPPAWEADLDLFVGYWLTPENRARKAAQ